MATKTLASSVERYTIFAFGVLFLIAILSLVVWIPKPTPTQFFAFRLTLALAAAGIGAFIPGFIHFQQSLPFKGLIRCGGAMALFATVWFTNPAQYAIEGLAPPPIEDARGLIEEYIATSDKNDYASAYSMFSNREKASLTFSSFTQLAQNVRLPLGGRVSGPIFFNSSNPEEISGRKGPFVINAYQSKFSGREGVWVEVAGAVAEEGKWRMYTYNVGPCIPPFCQPLPGLVAVAE